MWPLPRGTTAGSRWGSTTSLTYRYVEMHPGTESAPDLENGVLPRADDAYAFELDESFRIFRGDTDEDLSDVVGELGDALDGQGDDCASGLGGRAERPRRPRRSCASSPPTRSACARWPSPATARRARSPARESDLRELVEPAAATIEEFAEHTRAQQRALDRAPRLPREHRRRCARLDRRWTGSQGLVDRPRVPARPRCARSRAARAERPSRAARRRAARHVDALRSGRRPRRG